ncbi:hypothetical protein Tco_1128158 [Tanacetum coccineum]
MASLPGEVEDVLSTQIPNPPFYLDTEESDDDIEVTLNKEKFLSDHYIAQVTHPAYTPSIPFLTTIEPADTLLIGDEAISTTPARENNKFIKSSVDDLVPIPRESEVTSDSDDSKLRSYDVTFSNPLFDFNNDFTLCNDNPLFDEELEDISGLDPPKSTPVIDESTLLVTSLPDSKEISLRLNFDNLGFLGPV